MLTEKIVNIQTGEEIIQPISAEQEKEIQAHIEWACERKAENDARERVRKSALGKLIDLGLTEEEIAAL